MGSTRFVLFYTITVHLLLLVEGRKRKISEPEVEVSTAPGQNTDDETAEIIRQNEAESIRIGSFNLKQFGSKKANSTDVLKVIAKVRNLIILCMKNGLEPVISSFKCNLFPDCITI